MKVLKHFNIVIKSIIVVVAVFILEGTSNGSQFKVKNSNLNLSTDLTLMALKVEKNIQNDIYSAKETYIGDLTGYGADCPLCGGTLACKRDYNIRDGRDYYDDEEYKRVKIVASSRNLPCGSIVRFEVPKISDEPIIAIVLDRGVGGNNLDLLSPSDQYARSYVGRKSITYDVLRKGW